MDPDWLLDSTPRPVQMEALRRSYGGFGLQERLSDPQTLFPLRSGPARGWSHYLEMRLGKSALMLAEFELMVRDHGSEAMLIVCPNSFKMGWVDEIEKSGTLRPYVVWDSTKIKQFVEGVADAKKKGEAFIAIVNYEAIRTENAEKQLGAALSGLKYVLAIDESIKIKESKSLQTKAVLGWSKEAQFVRNLSGKPMTQGPQDLYPQLRATFQISGMTFWAFRGRFCKMGGYKNKKIVGTRNEEELNSLLRSASFIAAKRDWGREGEKNYYQEKLEVTPRQAKHYAEMDNDFMTTLDSGEAITVDVVISKMMKLVQISSGFIYNEGQVHYFEDPKKLPKMARLLDMMEEVRGKVIVCYHYSATGDLLLEQLKDHNPATIRGNLWMKKNGRDVEAEKKRFNEDPRCRVMVAQISASKYGHTLIGQEGDRCETMVFYENTYSLDDRSQVEMRNTYFDQNWVNNYHDFVGTKVEANTAKALEKKESIVSAVLNAYKGCDTPKGLLDF